jgi:nucleoside-diphosphate-sugar epimerase
MSDSKALVLGASGMVGEPLTQFLIDEGWQVFGAARFGDPSKWDAIEGMGACPIRFDVTTDDPAILPDVDVVFLEVWDPGRPDLVWPINVYGVGRVVERYAGVADIVNGCTINVYGDGPEPATEDTPCRPTSEYGRSRYAQERLIDFFAVRSNRKAIHVRYAHSNTAERGVIRRFAESIARSKSLGPNPDARIQVIGIEDFVRVTALSADRATCPPTWVNCCHPDLWSQRGLAEAIHQRLGHGAVLFDRPSGGIEHSACADASRMVEWFGKPTVSVDQLIQRVVEKLD